MSDADFIADTRNGKGKMPAYSGKLSDTEITDVVAYIRTLRKTIKLEYEVVNSLSVLTSNVLNEIEKEIQQ